MTTHRLQIPCGVRPPLHANQRYTKPQERRIIAETRESMGWVIKGARIGPQPYVTVGLEWRPATVRGRDGGENLGPLLKVCVDALMDAGVVTGDTPDIVDRASPVVLDVGRPAGLWFIVSTS